MTSICHIVSFSSTDIVPKKYKRAGVTNMKKTMSYSINNEDVIGGLSDSDIEVEHPASFGPIQSQA